MITTVFLNFYRDEDEQQQGVEEEEAEKGEGIYHKVLFYTKCCSYIYIAINIFHSGQTQYARFKFLPLFPPKPPRNASKFRTPPLSNEKLRQSLKS